MKSMNAAYALMVVFGGLLMICLVAAGVIRIKS